MSLVNFTIDLKNNELYQPVLAFEATNNAFLVLAKFKGELKQIKDKHFFLLEGINIRLENLIADGKYINLKCIDYIGKGKKNNARVVLRFVISNFPDMKKTVKVGLNDEFTLGGKERMEFQVSFEAGDCDGDTSMIDNGNWPCNLNWIA
jgi:hypothetical protein